MCSLTNNFCSTMYAFRQFQLQRKPCICNMTPVKCFCIKYNKKMHNLHKARSTSTSLWYFSFLFSYILHFSLVFFTFFTYYLLRWAHVECTTDTFNNALSQCYAEYWILLSIFFFILFTFPQKKIIKSDEFKKINEISFEYFRKNNLLLSRKKRKDAKHFKIFTKKKMFIDDIYFK